MTNWEKYFGTPEKTAKMRVKFVRRDDIEDCGISVSDNSWDAYFIPKDYYLDWLNAEAEEQKIHFKGEIMAEFIVEMMDVAIEFHDNIPRPTTPRSFR